MFKNLILLRIGAGWQADLSRCEEALQAVRFVPCGPTQPVSSGFVEPRGDKHGALIEAIGGHWILRLCTERRVLPGDVVKRELAEAVERIERETGRKPGKKERRDMKDEVVLNLLPKAFTKLQTLDLWIDPEAKLLVANAASVKKTDAVVTALVEAFAGFGVELVSTVTSPVAAMSGWLADGASVEPFVLGRETELKAASEDKASVRYARHSLDIDEIKQHIREGKLPVKLAMEWNDRVSFTLSEGLVVRKLSFLDVGEADAGGDDASGFDADVAILTGELSQMIPDLFAALGGAEQPTA